MGPDLILLTDKALVGEDLHPADGGRPLQPQHQLLRVLAAARRLPASYRRLVAVQLAGRVPLLLA